MVEEVRSVEVAVTVETNKETYRKTFGTVSGALEFLDKGEGGAIILQFLEELDFEVLATRVSEKLRELPGGIAGSYPEDDWVDWSLSGTAEAVVDVLRTMVDGTFGES
jgi:hypothetical protein